MFHRDVAKGVHRVEDSYTNWYLIEEDGKLTVVDCGLPGSWSSLLDALDRLDRSLSDIEAIVLTHGHFDHIGFAERARRELGIPVYVHENDVPLTKHPRSYSRLRSPAAYLIKPRALPIVASFVRMGALWPRAIAEVERFSDEGTLPV
ncbi:MAG TPA: MBL fold metallo-hydrolase, partial [Actinomycetota bacterium]|nr:MBL fold metallo-hydrolase [Actinomycetota bacterium]